MKLSDLKEKFLRFTKNISKDKIIDFFKKSWRYFAAAALFAVLILVMVKFGTDKKDADTSTGTETEAQKEEQYQVDAVPEINELITNYYTAYAAGDMAALANYATPVSANEQSFVTMFSQYVEAYQNIKCYTKKGLEDTSYLVSVYLEVKFAGADTAAPGLEFFYVRTNEAGALYIDNLYSSYNRLNEEQPTDEAVAQLIAAFEQQTDVVELQVDVQAKYDTAMAVDANLSSMVNTTIADAYAAWAMTVVPPSTEQPSAEPPATEQASEAPVEPEPETPPAVSETVYTTDKVNVRQEANETAVSLGMVEKGTALTRTGTTEDGWSSVDYNGTPAFIKSEYLAAEAPAPDEGAADAGIREGTTIQLSDTVNIRSSMSETASKVGVAYAGDSVTVVMSYAEGWTKVTWKNKTGYAKTEFLK